MPTGLRSRRGRAHRFPPGTASSARTGRSCGIRHRNPGLIPHNSAGHPLRSTPARPMTRCSRSSATSDCVRSPGRRRPARPAGRRAVLPRAASPGLLVLGLVLDNGGKADSLNAGINFPSYPLFCSIDADSILGQDALAKTALPFIEDPELVTPAPPHLPGPRAALRSPGRPAARESGQRSHRFRSSDCWRHRPCVPG